MARSGTFLPGALVFALLLAGAARADPPPTEETLRSRLEAWKERSAFQRLLLERLEWIRTAPDAIAGARLTLRADAEFSRRFSPLRVRIEVPFDPAAMHSPNGQAAARRLLEEGKALLRRAEYSEVALRFVERFAPVRAELWLDGPSPPRLRIYGGSGASAEIDAHLEFAGPTAALRSYRVPGIAEIPVRREILRFAEILTARHPACRARWVWAQRLSGDSESGGSTWQISATLDGPDCPPDLTVVLGPGGCVEPDGP